MAALGLGGGCISRRPPFPVNIPPTPLWCISRPASLLSLAQLLQSVCLTVSISILLKGRRRESTSCGASRNNDVNVLSLNIEHRKDASLA